MLLGSNIKAEKVSSLIAKDLPPLASWIDPGILPKRGLLLAGGHAKIGKSFLALEFARALATGTYLFGCTDLRTPEPCRVLYVEQELGEYGLQKRVKSIFKDSDPRLIEENLWYVTQQPKMKLDESVGVGIFEKIINDVRPNVMILDPMGKMHSGDENEAQTIEKLITSVEKLKKAGQDWDMSVIMIHHFGKPPQKKGEELIDEFSPYQFRGSSKWFDAPDTLMTVVRKRGEEKEDQKERSRSWKLKAKFVTRHDEELPPMTLEVNSGNDLRVRFGRWFAPLPPLAEVAPVETLVGEPQILPFG